MTVLSSGPGFDDPPTPFDSAARLMSQIGVQLTNRLTLVPPLPSRSQGLPAPPSGTAPVLVAVAHGSRDPAAARTVLRLLDLVRFLRPGLQVRLGHIELSEPLLDETLASLEGGAVLVPLLLGRGYHVKSDIPAALSRAPRLTGLVAAPLGPHPLLAEALHTRLTEAGWRHGAGRAVVLAAAGSRDPQSALDTGRTATLLTARLGVPVLPGYAASARPTVREAVAVLAARGYRDIAVASYFTAPGRFSAECAGHSPTVASPPLGAHPALARLLLERYDQALAVASGSAASKATTAGSPVLAAVAGR